MLIINLWWRHHNVYHNWYDANMISQVSDRLIKYALWHEGDPFVLERRTKRIKKCRGCRKMFVDEKFVVRHEEKVYFVKNNIQKQTIANVWYHCRPRCILRRHSDFDTNDLVIEPIVSNNLTTNDLKMFADDGFDLPYIVISWIVFRCLYVVR